MTTKNRKVAGTPMDRAPKEPCATGKRAEQLELKLLQLNMLVSALSLSIDRMELKSLGVRTYVSPLTGQYLSNPFGGHVTPSRFAMMPNAPMFTPEKFSYLHQSTPQPTQQPMYIPNTNIRDILDNMPRMQMDAYCQKHILNILNHMKEVKDNHAHVFPIISEKLDVVRKLHESTLPEMPTLAGTKIIEFDPQLIPSEIMEFVIDDHGCIIGTPDNESTDRYSPDTLLMRIHYYSEYVSRLMQTLQINCSLKFGYYRICVANAASGVLQLDYIDTSKYLMMGHEPNVVPTIELTRILN